MSEDPAHRFEEDRKARIAENSGNGALQSAARNFILDSIASKYSYNFTWLGRPIIQYPQDIVGLQELVWRVRPDLIVETGIAHGGSLILSASLLALLDLCDGEREGRGTDKPSRSRKVVGVDIEIRSHNRQAILTHPMATRIEMIEGSSIAPDVVARVHAIASNHARIMVLLDSNHTRDHVLHELRAYAPLVSVGSYCVVYDTVVENIPASEPADRPWRPGNSPMNSVDDYLAELADRPTFGLDSAALHFEIDDRIDAKLMISVAPRGYLLRT